MTTDQIQLTPFTYRGSLAKGIWLGLLTLIGGHAVMWSVLPGLNRLPFQLAFLVAPWIALTMLAVHWLQRRESRTVWGLGIAAAILVGTVLILFGLAVLIFSQGRLH